MRFSINDLIHDKPPSPTSRLSSNDWMQDPFVQNRLTESNNPFSANDRNEGLSISSSATGFNIVNQFPFQDQQKFHSVHGPSVPAARIFDGTAHLQGPQNTSEPPAYQPVGQSNGIEAEQPRGNSPQIPIQIEFTFYLATESPARPSNPRKRPPPASNEPRTEKKVHSDPDTIRIYWDAQDRNFERFKDTVIQAIGEKEGEQLAIFARTQDSAGNIDWCVSIPFGGLFAANHKRRLENSKVFARFITAAEGASDDRKVLCQLVKKDPKAIAEKASALKRLKQTQSGLNPDGLGNNPEVTPTASESSGAEITRLIRDILTAHDPCKQLSGSSEKPVFINPENQNELFVITFPKADAWARAIMSLNKPDSPQVFHLLLNQAPLQVNRLIQLHRSNTLRTSAPSGLSNPVASTSTAQPSEAPVIKSSPAPSDGTSNLEDFLKFARGNGDSVALNEGLNELGITHWSMFQLTNVEELVDAGIPRVSARSLLRAFRRYSKMKKNDTHHD
ncbi:uncharacterized protein PGTG_09954 [Puccinia graminis f. sp. tritici CRL 75-36-700-3]|uniref:Uncharacterized protein n=1 Tax=Puccinia graminis f. sp. tritici (strain CRL 75-36-700-3 / race SCCL) TaxID=418459 RepID=E3KFF9_PUCGT|nr:uncharacterized protein PGTG_09954 [Puccinia graminis f. sp. tritici CRL 75-36-700-3]EFP82986.2 hypothetical protein PGTG_09954 [Puccinia graminis f. sp. tritici CRL 75-36-700-3]